MATLSTAAEQAGALLLDGTIRSEQPIAEAGAKLSTQLWRYAPDGSFSSGTAVWLVG